MKQKKPQCVHLYRQLFLSMNLMENPILHTRDPVDYFLSHPIL